MIPEEQVEHHQKITIEQVDETLVQPKEQKASSSEPLVAVSVFVGAVIIAASISYSADLITKSLSQFQFAGNGVQVAQGSVAQAGAGQQGQQAQPAAPVSVTPRDDAPVLGNKNAKVTIVEFGDFQCPFCQSFFKNIFPQIKSQYIDTGKVKLVFRHFPLTQIHVNAEIAAQAAECANRQNKFWEYHDMLYTNGQGDGTNLDKASLERYADQLGLNNGTFGFGKNKFNQCLESNATQAVVQADLAEGNKLGITGTPSFFINGQLIVGAQPFESTDPRTTPFRPTIDAALAK